MSWSEEFMEEPPDCPYCGEYLHQCIYKDLDVCDNCGLFRSEHFYVEGVGICPKNVFIKRLEGGDA